MLGNLVIFLGGMLAGALLFPQPNIMRCIYRRLRWR